MSRQQQTTSGSFAVSFIIGALACILFSSSSVRAQQDIPGTVAVDAATSIIGSIIPALIFGFWGICFLVLCSFIVLWLILAIVVGVKQHKQMKEKGMDKEWVTTFLLWFFLSWTGAHRIYNGDNRGFIILVLYVISWLTAWFLVGGILCFFLLIFITTDLFRLPRLTEMGIEKRNSKAGTSAPAPAPAESKHEQQPSQQPSSFIAPPPPVAPAATFYSDPMIQINQPVAQYNMDQPHMMSVSHQSYPYLQQQQQQQQV